MKSQHQKEVCKIYDHIIDWFDQHRDKSLNLERKIIEFVEPHLPKNGKILDVGCGLGEPIASHYISLNHAVTGIDASQKMIALCHKRFPHGLWKFFDMRKKNLEFNGEFDLVIAWHSFFHLPREDQPATLKLLCSYVKPNGILVFTSGTKNGELWSENGGENLYHASLSQEQYKAILDDADMKQLLQLIEDPDCGGASVWVLQNRGKKTD